MVGKVLLANVYFTDLSSYKIRPIIVIKDMKEDILCLPLTTNLSAMSCITILKCKPINLAN